MEELAPNLLDNLLLKQGERFIGAWRGDYGPTPTQIVLHCYLALTNQRLVFLRIGGVLSKTFMVSEVVDLEAIINASVQKVLLGKAIFVNYLVEGKSTPVFFGKAPVHGGSKALPPIQEAIQKARVARLAEIEQEKKQARVQYVLDFSFLKAQLDKGGLAISAIKCPNCAGSLEIPSGGTTTKCPHCGTSVVAQDVFDRMKGLVGGLA